jgi:hypothetical protein
MTMISDRNVYEAASTFIKRFGNAAPVEAAIRADDCQETKDIEGQRVWVRVLEAIIRLERKPAPGEPVN